MRSNRLWKVNISCGVVSIIEPENAFEIAVVQFCTELGLMLIEKNRKYQNSYADSRLETLKLFGSDRIPFYMHAIEKIKRYMSEDNGEDSLLDLAGYCILEKVCRGYNK